MLRFHPLRRGRRALGAMLVVVVGVGTLAALATTAGAAAPTVEGPSANVHFVQVTSPDNLTQGSVMQFKVTTDGGVALNNVTAQLCTPNLTGWTVNNYSYSGSQGVRCVKQFTPNGIVAGTGLDASPAAGIQAPTYRIDTVPFSPSPPTTDSGVFNFTVGTGTVDWYNAGGFPSPGPATLTCGPGSPCDMVVQVNSTAGTTWIVQQLTFLTTPAAPTLAVPNVIDADSVSLDWNDVPNATGYEVCVDTVAGGPAAASPLSAADCSFAVTPTVGSSLTVNGLVQFTPYFFTVRAQNAAGYSANSNERSATPGPAGPTGLSGTAGNESVNLTWDDDPVGPETGYSVVAYADADCGGAPLFGPFNFGANPSFPATVGPLTGQNGTALCFGVVRNFSGGSSSASFVHVTPGAQAIYQTINVTRPEGVLVLSQRCAAEPSSEFGPFDSALPDFQDGGATGDFDPSNLDGDLTVTRCLVNLSGPRDSHLRGGSAGDMRTVHDGITVAGSDTVTSALMNFTATDVGQLVTGTGIPADTRIQSVGVVSGGTSAVLSSPASFTIDDADLTVLGRSIVAAPGVFVGADDTHDVQGVEIPGGTVVTNAGNFTGTGGFSISFIDLSQPTNHASSGTTVRIFEEAPTPARLVTSGPNSGKYLEAIGKMAQVYIVDYRSTDAGWDATGQVDQFCDGSGAPSGPANDEPALAPRACDTVAPGLDNTFSGNQLGWTPKARRVDGGTVSALNMTVGSLVTPGTALGLQSAPQTLAVAGPGEGLGVVRMDADLTLWIPVAVPGGDYQTTLTLSLV